MDKYVVGQKVRVIAPKNSMFLGVVGVISQPRQVCTVYSNGKVWEDFVYEVDVSKEEIKALLKGTPMEHMNFESFAAKEEFLEPLEDPNQKVSWDDCAWKPDPSMLIQLGLEKAITDLEKVIYNR